MKQFFQIVFASFLGIILSMIVFIGIVVAILSGIGDDPKPLLSNSILTINLKSQIAERGQHDPFSELTLDGKDSKMGLQEIIAAIETARYDKKIDAIYLNISNVPTGWAGAEALRNALSSFKKTKKSIIAYSEIYTQKGYYLASVANKVYLHPEGYLEFRGLSVQKPFFKKSLEKLGVEVQVLRVGTYKSAVEPFILDKMSNANKKQTQELLGSIYTHFLSAISDTRHVTVEQLHTIANELKIREAKNALEYKLIDGIKYEDEVLTELHTISKKAKEEELETISLEEYVRFQNEKEESYVKDRIAIIYAEGDIVSGKGNKEQIGAEKFVSAIRGARMDANVKAIVIRINSPGGLALSSDVIWRELSLAKSQKPLVASMGNVAASGGYYMACAAHKIMAQETSITGSIGIFGLIPNAQKLFEDKLGITFDGVKTANFADMGNLMRPLTEQERTILQHEVERGYQTFITKVAQGRHSTPQKIDSIGQGRVWTGKDALKIGLVDTIGGLNDAIKMASQMAKLKKYQIEELPAQHFHFSEIVSGVFLKSKGAYLKATMGENQKYFYQLENIKHCFGVQTRMLEFTEIN